jgi:[ribosomal protein S5]-alanine N-acetyltransferase
MELKTIRLLMRPYREEDISTLVRLLGAREVAATTLRIAHPYTEADARAFLKAQESPAAKFGMFEVSTGDLVGGIGLSVEEQHQRAELGYWVGVPYWNKGYATEAAREMVRHGFEDLKLNRIYAGVFGGNPASEQVLRKIGMKHEGTSRQHFLKWGKFLDDECYGMLAADWFKLNR